VKVKEKKKMMNRLPLTMKPLADLEIAKTKMNAAPHSFLC
jgi:hypothetical protein